MNRRVSISPEYRLLLQAAVGAPLEAGERRPREELDWDRVLDLAAWHRLSPVLYRHLVAGTPAPPHALAILEQTYLANSARNLFVRASMWRVLDALASAGIPAMLLKGAALVESVYPDPALREMVDLDILVPGGQLDVANAALASIGFGRAMPAGTGPDAQAWRLYHMHDPPLVSEDRLVAVELHHHIAIGEERDHFDVAGVWQRAGSPRTGGHLLPSPEDLLLHVCFHFTRNREGRSDGALAQISDIAWILERVEIDWARFSSTVREYRLESRVHLALFAARELGVAVPERPMADLRKPGFDPTIGRRLIELRVLRAGRRFPVRPLAWMVTPPREVLVDAWGAGAEAGALALARAYARRAAAQLPQARGAVKEPRAVLADYRLNRQISMLARDGRGAPARYLAGMSRSRRPPA